MKKTLLFILVFSMQLASAQNIGIGTNTPDSSALLELNSSSKGFLPPRMTTAQRNAIVNPAVGLQIYNTTTDCVEIFGKGKWHAMYCIPVDTTLITDIDGNSYPTVKICNQTWMAKNLDVARYRNGDIIPQVTDPTQWANLTTGAWCWYNNDSATYGSTYGRLYNWYAVNDPRGLAPQGWHVPSDVEWDTLVNCLGGANVAGGKMKEVGTSHWISPNTGATNSSGFGALAGGYRNDIGVFGSVGGNFNWWSSLNLNNSDAMSGYLYYLNINVVFGGIDKHYGFSVRCIKDAPPPSTIDSGLVAYYPFNGNAIDESGNGNNGTVNGATLTNDRYNSSNSAYEVDGINCPTPKGVSLPVSVINSEYTISIWCKSSDSLKQNQTIINSFPHGYISLSLNYGLPNTLNKICSNYGNGHWLIGGDIINWNSINKQNWKNFIIVKKSNALYFYENGNLSFNQQISILSNPGTIESFTCGGISINGGSECYETFKGKLDDIRIYNRALTQEEIIYLAGH